MLCQREFFIDYLLVRIHFIIVMIRWTGLAPWEFEFPFPGSLASTFLVADTPLCGGRLCGGLFSSYSAHASLEVLIPKPYTLNLQP